MPRLWRLVGCHGNPSHSFPTQLVNDLRLVTGLTSNVSESGGGRIALFPLKFEECEVIHGDIREKVHSQSLSDRREKSIRAGKILLSWFFFYYWGRTNLIFKVTAERTFLTTLFWDVLKELKGTVHSKSNCHPDVTLDPKLYDVCPKKQTYSLSHHSLSFHFHDIHWK